MSLNKEQVTRILERIQTIALAQKLLNELISNLGQDIQEISDFNNNNDKKE